jgi:hypothetical protein
MWVDGGTSLELLVYARVAEEGTSIDRAQATGALHSRTIEKSMANAKNTKVNRRVRTH